MVAHKKSFRRGWNSLNNKKLRRKVKRITDNIKECSMFWYIVTMFAISYALQRMNRQKMKTNTIQPDENIQAPRAEEGAPFAVLFGTRRVSGPNVVWYGDIKTTAIRK